MKNNKVLIIITLIMLLAVITFATYAYFATGLLNVSNVANLNAVTERNNMVFDTIGGEISLNVTAANMVEDKQGSDAAYDENVLVVNFTSNTDYRMACTYDIVYEWTSTDRYTTHSPGETGIEFGIGLRLESSAGVSSGTNYAEYGVDLSELVGNQNSATVVSGASIAGTGANTTTSTYNGSTYQYEPNYTHPATGGPVQTSGTATGHNVYIGQDSSKYYACGTTQGHEMCLSQPYTQYGLSGHTLNSDLTSEQQASAKQAIYQAFIDAGITVNIDNDCFVSGDYASCSVGDLICDVNVYGYVGCSDLIESCNVNASGHAYCLGMNDTQ